MKIDLLITELETGGAERCCAELAIYLERRGHRVRVVSIGPAPEGDAKETLVKKVRHAGIQIEFLNASNPSQLWGASRNLSRLIRKDRPDIAQTFLWHANVLGAWCYSRLQIPIVTGERVVDPRGWRNWLTRKSSQWVSRVVCVSDEVAAWCNQTVGIDREKLLVIPNGIAIPKESELDLSLHATNAKVKESRTHSDSEPTATETEPILLFVGRLEVQKGIDVLLRQADSLLSSLPSHRLVLLGDGRWMDAWREWIAKSPNSHRVSLLGKRKDVRDWMLRSELLLLPARYEGMPNVVLEAMAVGRPVAVTQVEGIKSLLGDSLQEQSVPAGDWEGWKRLVIRLAQDPALRNRLGSANRERVKVSFRLEDQLSKYEGLYSEVLNY